MHFETLLLLFRSNTSFYERTQTATKRDNVCTQYAGPIFESSEETVV